MGRMERPRKSRAACPGERRRAPDPSHQAQWGPVRAESLRSLGIPELQTPVLSVRLASEILQSCHAKTIPDEIWPPETR